MATVYVSSVDGNDADNGSTWDLAKATIAGAFAVATDATNLIYVDSAHAETSGGAITWNAPTSGSHVTVVSVNRSTGAWLAGASATAANGTAFSIASSGSQYLYIYGMTVIGGSGAVALADVVNIATAAAHVVVTLVSCTITNPGTSNSSTIKMGASAGGGTEHTRVNLQNCALNIANTAGATGITIHKACVEWINTTIGFAGANKPTTCFQFAIDTGQDVSIIDSDLSGYNTSGGTYFKVTAYEYGRTVVTNCKLSSTPGLITGTWPANGSSITLVNTDSGDTHNVFEYRNRLGTITENTSQYANNGGQFDGSGISLEIVTTSACWEGEPFVTPWLKRWVTATGSQDLHLQLIRDSATDYTNREVWGEFEVLESASFPNGTLTSTRNAQPFDGSAVDLTNSSEAWTETLTNDNEMECRVTRTVAEKSLARARLSVGVASTTLYLDPALRIGSQGNNPRVAWDGEGIVAMEPTAAGSGGGLRLAGPGGLAA